MKSVKLEADFSVRLTPFFLQHGLYLSPEYTWSGILLASFLCFDELVRLREAQTDQANNDGKSSTDPEHNFPAVCGSTDTEIDTGCEYVA